jgi:hypothetical protein
MAERTLKMVTGVLLLLIGAIGIADMIREWSSIADLFVLDDPVTVSFVPKGRTVLGGRLFGSMMLGITLLALVGGVSLCLSAVRKRKKALEEE